MTLQDSKGSQDQQPSSESSRTENDRFPNKERSVPNGQQGVPDLALGGNQNGDSHSCSDMNDGQESTTQSPASPQEEEWMQYVCEKYPTLLSGTNFFPPLHFNKVPWTAIQVRFGQREVWKRDYRAAQVAVCLQNSRRQPSNASAPESREVVSGNLFTSHGERLNTPNYQPSDSLDDLAQSRVRQYLGALSSEGAMMVVTQLQFKKYLCQDQGSPLPSCEEEGDWDVIIIHRHYGIIFGEVKSVGRANKYFRKSDKSEQLAMIVTQVQKALKQVKKQENELAKLVSDLKIKVTKTLFFPFITRAELTEALNTSKKDLEEMCLCMGTENVEEAVKRCLCWNDIMAADILSEEECEDLELPGTSCPEGRETSWWQEAVAVFGMDQQMSDEVFLRLVGRFCGPATEVEIPTICAPRYQTRNNGRGPRERVVRAVGEAVAETGLIMSRLSLHSQQLDVLADTPDEASVYLCGPPGTGKTVVLVLKALEMLHKGYHVHILSSSPDSAAVSTLIHHQLTLLINRNFSGQLYRPHFYELTKGDNVIRAVHDLAGCYGARMFLLIDEITYHVRPYIQDLVQQLYLMMEQLDRKLTVWGSGVYSDVPLPIWLEKKELSIPLRCPPNIHREVRQSERIGGSGHLIPSYQVAPGIPPPTEGPGVVWLRHEGQGGHSAGDPEDCLECGHIIADSLNRMGVGRPGNPLQWNDVFVLSDRLGDSCKLLEGLRQCQVPFTFVPRDADQSMILALATANTNTVTLTDTHTVAGLERRVVVGMGNSGFSRCGAMSRCTSQLFWIDSPATV